MAFEQAFFSIGRLDRLSYQDTFVHRLDPRIKVVATMLFVVTVTSFSKYEVQALVPFLLFPVVLLALGDLPVGFLLRKVLLVSPFAAFVGIFNPVLDTRTALVLFGVPLSAGWISFASIMLKFLLAISAALILIATTSFPGVCQALRRMGVPALFVSQLLFLYRYLFILLEETMRMVRARDLRSFGGRGMEARVAVRIIGALFLRAMERAERIYQAMLARGFSGEVPVLRRMGLRLSDMLFLVATLAYLAAFRLFPLPAWTGRVAQELLK